jgi:hypothetical protein
MSELLSLDFRTYFVAQLFLSVGMYVFVYLFSYLAGCPWLMPIILATWKAEISWSTVQGQAEQIVF